MREKNGQKEEGMKEGIHEKSVWDADLFQWNLILLYKDGNWKDNTLKFCSRKILLYQEFFSVICYFFPLFDVSYVCQ
jgi:hypothetical protein